MRRLLPLSTALVLSTALAASCGTKPPQHGHPPPPDNAGTTGTGAAATTDPKLLTPLPIDPRIKVGKLDNGLTYYILEHRKPEKRAQLWLAVNTGAVQEDDDQQGLAHFVEHMAFNGTKKYKEQALIDYLESLGVKFGPDLNAYTSFEETVYQLQVPTSDDKVVAKGFDILHQWAHALLLDPKEIDKERGVVLEEWRLGRGADTRLLDKQLPVILHGSRYAKRLPIGQAKIIKKAPYDAFRRYYQDWYRPELMAVVAVGDFEAHDIEARIKTLFGDLKPASKARPKPSSTVPTHKDTLVSIETDPEATTTNIGIYNKKPHRPDRTAMDYRRMIGEDLIRAMLSERFREIRDRPSSPLVSAYSSSFDWARSVDTMAQYAQAKEGRIMEALDVLATEVTRAEQHGFSKGELERAKKQSMRSYERAVEERDKADAYQFAAEIVRNYMTHEVMPGIEAEHQLAKKFLPTFTLEELNRMARSWGGAANRVVTISGPSTIKDKPTKAAVLAALARVQNKKLEPWLDKGPDAPLMAKKPSAGTIKAEKTIPELGVTEWTLSNGARVIIKPTDFQNDEVQFAAFSPGGHSLVPDSDFESARMATSVVSASGVGALSRTQLQKTLTGKVINILPYIGELEEGFWGSFSPKDIETAMQLLHMRFTSPRKDPEAFSRWKQQMAEQVRNRRKSPLRAFFEDMRAAASKNHLRRRPVTLEALDKVKLDEVVRIYAERFESASDFSFLFVGNVTPKKLRPFAESYLASLPGKARKEKWKDVKVRRPRGVKKLTVKQGIEPKSAVFLDFHGPARWSKDAANDIEMLGEVLSIRLREVLREDMGGVYGSYSSGSISRRPKQERDFILYFGCAPENVTKLTNAALKEIQAIQKKGIGQSYIDKVKKGRTLQHETDLKENWYWLSELTEAYRYGDDPRGILKFDEMVEKISSKRVQAAARKYLGKNQYLFAVLKPAGKKK